MSDGPPSTPPRKTVVQRAGAHLHKRTSSKITLLLSPPTPPHGSAASSTSYRIIPESPSTSRIMSPPSKRRAAVQPLSWAPGAGAATKQSGFWTRGRVLVLVGMALVVLVVARRPSVSTAGWRRHGVGAGDDEQATYGRANVELPPARKAAPVAPEPVRYYPAPPRPHAPGAAPAARARPHKGPVARPAARPAPPHDLEVTSATDPDTARRFLLVGWMGEQETKAQQHLYQLGLLSLALNRTLVLPTVKRSRFGTCFNHPFSLYYAEDTLANFGFPYVTSDEFWAWTDRQRSAPSAQVVSLVRGATDSHVEPGRPLEHMCLSERNLDFGEFEKLAFFNDGKSAAARADFGVALVQRLLEQEPVPDRLDPHRKTPSVLAADVHLRYPFLTPSLVANLSPFTFPRPSPYSYFSYAPHWTALGERIASSLSPFIAVHWRTETLPVETLAPCGDALVAALEALAREHPELGTVYLATDYPLEVARSTDAKALERATAHSGTMTKTLTPAHHAAMRRFIDKVDKSSLRVTTFLDEMKGVELPDELQKMVGAGGLQDLDGAIVGIVDKIVLMQAEVFYAGLPVSESPQGCAKASSFTTQITNGRHALREGHGAIGSRLWGDVEHFALPGGRMARKGGGGKRHS
ncbi:hypothetical protein JCM9279_000254 [Rhodotorula babjevae]